MSEKHMSRVNRRRKEKLEEMKLKVAYVSIVSGLVTTVTHVIQLFL